MNLSAAFKEKLSGSIKLLPFIFIFFSAVLFPQVKTNLDLFNMLVDSSAGKILSDLPDTVTQADVQLNSGETYGVFNSRLLSTLYNHLSSIKRGNSNQVLYTVDYAAVQYGDMERDGFLGSYIIPRKVLLQGNYIIEGEKPSGFSYSYTDTITADQLAVVENSSLPVTRGEAPAEPFFSGLFEPIVAIGISAAAIILFFTVRSK